MSGIYIIVSLKLQVHVNSIQLVVRIGKKKLVKIENTKTCEHLCCQLLNRLQTTVSYCTPAVQLASPDVTYRLRVFIEMGQKGCLHQQNIDPVQGLF